MIPRTDAMEAERAEAVLAIEGDGTLVVRGDAEPDDVMGPISGMRQRRAHQLRRNAGTLIGAIHINLPELQRSARRDGNVAATLQNHVADHLSFSLSDIGRRLRSGQQLLEVRKIRGAMSRVRFGSHTHQAHRVGFDREANRRALTAHQATHAAAAPARSLRESCLVAEPQSFFNRLDTQLLEALEVIAHFLEPVGGVTNPVPNLADDAKWIPRAI